MEHSQAPKGNNGVKETDMQEDIDIEKSISILSSNGWQRADFILRKEFLFHGDKCSIYELHLINNFWEREELITEGCTDLINDRNLIFSQLVIENAKWREFINKISTWSKTFDLFAISLSSFNGLDVEVELKVIDELISSEDKPVFEISINDSKIDLSWRMIIDSSCISS